MVKMYGVGMLGSYLTQGVYAVAGPFQAFGCAVDIIVVQQEDGTFKSSPWYVKFGDFQGGLKGTEKTVGISVNDVRANFHMFLDKKGEACFEKDAECEEDLGIGNGDLGVVDTVLAVEAPQSNQTGNSVEINMETVLIEQRLKELDILVDREVGTCADDAPQIATTLIDKILHLGNLDERLELQGEPISDLEKKDVDPSIDTVNTGLANDDGVGIVTVAAEKGMRILGDTGPVDSNDACGGDDLSSDAMAEDSALTSANDETEETVLADCKGTIAEKEVPALDSGNFLEIFNSESCMGVGDVSSGIIADDLNYENVISDSTVWLSDNLENEDVNEVVITSAENDGAEEKGKDPESDVVIKSEGSMSGDETSSNKEETDSQSASMSSPPSRWSMWPLSFRRSRASPPSSSFKKEADSAVPEELLPKNGYYKWSHKPKVRTYVPTSAQIASLKLKDGPNKVTFIFSQVLGKKTEVDARIYLWNWKTRIVISDVDGTITKSDVLGQVMPLVGRDWSQSGVTRLFSAIKDNGYEVLFLSARAISQAYLTRQFLLNLKQDGEALPEGPVFISPDGLFPSLYREVIKRSPHEFKIACLEDIRELFPRDVNPFYAGFGNRNTDEISYLKVGIPKGKIFIINPKGEVMVNHRVDTRTYTSLHALVDDMFPPVSSFEQEDYNSWNFWKLPLPNVEVEPQVKSKKVGSVKK